MDKLKTFQGESVKFIETITVAEGVVCDVYEYVNDDSKDLGIISIAKGCKTPRQRVLSGDKTIEGYISGSASLTVTNASSEQKRYEYVDNERASEVLIEIGEIMQWSANQDSICYEICYPKYVDGRYENLPD